MAGFINVRTLVIVILILVILGLSGVSVEHDVVENEQVQENTSYVWNGVKNVWNTYLAGPAHFLWQDVFVNILWTAFMENMGRLRDGNSPTYFDTPTGNIPSVPNLIDGYNSNH